MGANQSTIYAKPIEGTQKEGQTAIYRNIDSMDRLVEVPDKLSSLNELWQQSFKHSKNTKFLGHRPVVDGKVANFFTWMTFGEIEIQSKHLGSGILNNELAPVRSEFQDYNLKMVAVYSKNSPEYVILDAACNLYGITTVPIYDTLGEEACEFMFSQTNLTTVFCTTTHMAGIVKACNSGSYGKVKTLVIMDEDNLPADWVSPSVPWIYKWSDIIKAGKDSVQEYHKTKPEDIYTFSYTSGTTSEPKGVMMTHKNVLTMINSFKELAKVDGEIRYVSYLPLAHVYERVIMNYILYSRGKYGIFAGDVFKLNEDLAALKPTIFASVPRLYNKFYDGIINKMDQVTGIKKCLMNKAIKSKIERLRKNGKVTHALYDKLVFKPMKARLGGEVQILLTASAPIDQSVLEFLKICFCAPIVEAYGQTEGTGGEFSSSRFDNTMGHVGGPLSCNEFKLIDVPDMKYTSQDRDANGN